MVEGTANINLRKWNVELRGKGAEVQKQVETEKMKKISGFRGFTNVSLILISRSAVEM